MELSGWVLVRVSISTRMAPSHEIATHEGMTTMLALLDPAMIV